MQFRKSTSILLAIFILFSNLGLAFNVHYCEDEIAGISLNTIVSEPCAEEVTACCAMQPSHDSCCSNKVVKVDKKQDNFLSKSFKLDFQPVYFFEELLVFTKNTTIFFSKTKSPSFYCDSHAPPFINCIVNLFYTLNLMF
uniref:HYC_CC_PP family protein n=1 Tax=Flavobacterium sp. TaxID=239 RepID=UPI00404B5BD9